MITHHWQNNSEKFWIISNSCWESFSPPSGINRGSEILRLILSIVLPSIIVATEPSKLLYPGWQPTQLLTKIGATDCV